MRHPQLWDSLKKKKKPNELTLSRFLGKLCFMTDTKANNETKFATVCRVDEQTEQVWNGTEIRQKEGVRLTSGR